VRSAALVGHSVSEAGCWRGHGRGSEELPNQRRRREGSAHITSAEEGEGDGAPRRLSSTAAVALALDLDSSTIQNGIHVGRQTGRVKESRHGATDGRQASRFAQNPSESNSER